MNIFHFYDLLTILARSCFMTMKALTFRNYKTTPEGTGLHNRKKVQAKHLRSKAEFIHDKPQQMVLSVNIQKNG